MKKILFIIQYSLFTYTLLHKHSPHGITNRVQKVHLYDVPCYMMNGQSADEMIALVKKAMETHTLLVFLFHGVDGEHNINVSLEAHSGLLHFLKENEKNIWIAPMIDVAEFIKSKQ